jgi:hypothetical protein
MNFQERFFSVLKILKPTAQNVRIPLPTLRSCDRLNNLTSSSITNRFHSLYNFSIHPNKLSHHSDGDRRFIRNVSKFHQLTVRKATVSSSYQIVVRREDFFCVSSKLLSDEMTSEFSIKMYFRLLSIAENVHNSIRKWVHHTATTKQLNATTTIAQSTIINAYFVGAYSSL